MFSILLMLITAFAVTSASAQESLPETDATSMAEKLENAPQLQEWASSRSISIDNLTLTPLTASADNCEYPVASHDLSLAGPLTENSAPIAATITYCRDTNEFMLQVWSRWPGEGNHLTKLELSGQQWSEGGVPVYFNVWEAENVPQQDGVLKIQARLKSQADGGLHHLVLIAQLTDTVTGVRVIQDFSYWLRQYDWRQYLPLLGLNARRDCNWTYRISYGGQSERYSFERTAATLRTLGTLQYGEPVTLQFFNSAGQPALVEQIAVQSRRPDFPWEYQIRPVEEYGPVTTYVGRHPDDGYQYPANTFRLNAGYQHNVNFLVHENGVVCRGGIDVTWDPPLVQEQTVLLASMPGSLSLQDGTQLQQGLLLLLNLVLRVGSMGAALKIGMQQYSQHQSIRKAMLTAIFWDQTFVLLAQRLLDLLEGLLTQEPS